MELQELKKFDNCIVKYEYNTLYVYNTNNELLGTICGTDPMSDWDLIKNGHNPIDEKWEDGAGNTCTLNGWNNAL